MRNQHSNASTAPDLAVDASVPLSSVLSVDPGFLIEFIIDQDPTGMDTSDRSPAMVPVALQMLKDGYVQTIKVLEHLTPEQRYEVGQIAHELLDTVTAP